MDSAGPTAPIETPVGGRTNQTHSHDMLCITVVHQRCELMWHLMQHLQNNPVCASLLLKSFAFIHGDEVSFLTVLQLHWAVFITLVDGHDAASGAHTYSICVKWMR